MATNSSLYGVTRPKKSAKEISSSTSLAFTSQLSSLLSKDGNSNNISRTSSGRPRPSHSKSDIFTAHNKNTKKRAAKDLEDDGSTATGNNAYRNSAAVDSTVLHRSKRKMEEKARLYAAMKRGDYVPPRREKRANNNLEENALVDFDRKWAENEERGEGNDFDTSSDDDHHSDTQEEELVEYTDEFGRQRQGTRADVAREERRKRIVTAATEEPDRFTARPAQPSNLIFGDTVQAAAFNPDEPIAAKMDEIAAKRDRSMTPPEEMHYDANAEIRSKGVGFYAFSKDKETRSKEMDELERERMETERNRKEMTQRKEKRKVELEERRKKIREMRGEKQADRFLESLMGEMEKHGEE